MSAPTSRIHVGIDPSANSTGLAIILPRVEGNVILTKTIRPGNLKDEWRLVYIRDHLRKEITIHMPLPIVACVEGPSLKSQSHSDTLGQVRGVCLLTLADLNSQVYIIPPKSLKKFAVHGNATKEQVIQSAAKKWDRLLSDDEADALWLAQISYSLHTNKVDNRKQMEVIYGIRESLGSKIAKQHTNKLTDI